MLERTKSTHLHTWMQVINGIPFPLFPLANHVVVNIRVSLARKTGLGWPVQLKVTCSVPGRKGTSAMLRRLTIG